VTQVCSKRSWQLQSRALHITNGLLSVDDSHLSPGPLLFPLLLLVSLGLKAHSRQSLVCTECLTAACGCPLLVAASNGTAAAAGGKPGHSLCVAYTVLPMPRTTSQ
jgi:hypothetical protein